MKKLSRITLVLLISFFTGSVAFASFPYTKEQKTSTETQVLTETVIEKDAIRTFAGDFVELLITLVLWLFLGWIAAHRWYRKKSTFWNIVFIICFWGGIAGSAILGLPFLGLIGAIWYIVDLIMILTGEF
ncbi:MAG: hypothetical protein PF481_04480 [Bacteroidales bacterium]|jgi:hypothetical protein|nr:hypothetical protein [Bacteroidales bacterium]